MLRYGKSESEAEDMIENDGKYWGVKSKIRRLDDWTAKYATDQSVAFTPFVDSVLYRRWDSDLYGRRILRSMPVRADSVTMMPPGQSV